ncbi:hypothetical protein HMPREF5505_0785, partial [Lactobacillus delbrueckii subsp. lactis DSM 20072]
MIRIISSFQFLNILPCSLDFFIKREIFTKSFEKIAVKILV